MKMSDISSMTAAQQIDAVRALGPDHQRAAPPASWAEWTEVDDDGTGTEWLLFELDGWVLKAQENPELCGLAPDDPGFTSYRHHIVLSSMYLPKVKPWDITLQTTTLGGCTAPYPPCIKEQGAHVRMLHCMSDDMLNAVDWRTIKQAEGAPIKVRISGHVAHVARHPDIDPEAAELAEFKSFRSADHRCPTVCIQSVEVLGEARSRARDLVSFRIPFTRRHIGLSLIRWSYDRPADPDPPAQHQQPQMQRMAQPMPRRA